MPENVCQASDIGLTAPWVNLSNRRFTYCLLLSTVLILGIVQWSFLPILTRNQPLTRTTELGVSAGRTAKFAAPFNGLFDESLKPRAVKAVAVMVAPILSATFFPLLSEPSLSREDQVFSSRQLRSPPSV